MYDIPQDKLPQFSYYGHYHLYTLQEVETAATDSLIHFINDKFEYDWDHRNCVTFARAFKVDLELRMPGAPLFLIDIYPPLPERYGHMYVGVIVRVNGFLKCYTLDYRYPDAPMKELAYDRIGHVQMAPKG